MCLPLYNIASKLRGYLPYRKYVKQTCGSRPYLDIAVSTTRYKSFSCRAQCEYLCGARVSANDRSYPCNERTITQKGGCAPHTTDPWCSPVLQCSRTEEMKENPLPRHYFVQLRRMSAKKCTQICFLVKNLWPCVDIHGQLHTALRIMKTSHLCGVRLHHRVQSAP